MSDHSEQFVASIASALNSCQIPCVLWGHCLLRVHGIPSIVAAVDYVVPDHLLTASEKALKVLPRLSPCPSPKTCLASSPDRPTPPPAFHLHITNSELTVGLYRQSETLWFLPTLNDSLVRPDASKLPPPFLLAQTSPPSHNGAPAAPPGVFKSGEQPVVVPKAHVLLEAFLRIYLRDAGRHIGAFAMSMIGYVEMYVDEDGLLDVDELPEPLRSSYAELKLGEKPLRQWRTDLTRALQMSEDEDGW
ncbi:hypothetical protein CGRA01v4_04295 [Colletotrichum graminicola]|uniref:Thioredoxin reductase n=1 Tax=Colletotrichum graminicola (strain M1.001 / M2 / FGSC 10212) TaxID=645133 RepID=E3Q960_COLGM|nr:uncharacterized protein GLRG_01734 [Colletotrichum graminicola M1.001]EFQ27239.1 hypothetical protein GLRG_01734 [Colletotrichum graminicola M1.001]WDK13014.1 hypothetical protein CGRA01v4_04295 [Colletotrichum graminicola]